MDDDREMQYVQIKLNGCEAKIVELEVECDKLRNILKRLE